MGKLVTRAILVCAAVSVCAGGLAKDAAVRVFVDDRETKLEPAAIVRDGRAYVGLRAVADALGACTKWDEKTKTAVVTAGNKRARVAQSDGIMVRGSLFLPLRKTGQAIGCGVEWDADERAVRIATEAPAPIGGG